MVILGSASMLALSACGGSSGNTLASKALTVQQASQLGGVPVVKNSKVSTGVGLGSDATLDLCVGNFPSETLRAQRYQEFFNPPNDPKLVVESNEIVRYKPGGTTQAYQELLAVAKACKAMVLTQGQYSQPTIEPTSPRLAAEQLTVAYSITPTAPPGTSPPGAPKPSYQVEVYQFQGDLFDGVYVNRGNPQDALSAAQSLATAAAQHLAAAARH